MINSVKAEMIKNANKPSAFSVINNLEELQRDQPVIIGEPHKPSTWQLGYIDDNCCIETGIFVDIYDDDGVFQSAHLFQQSKGELINPYEKIRIFKIAHLDKTFSQIQGEI